MSTENQSEDIQQNVEESVEEALQARIDTLENELGQLRDDQVRDRAELENQRKRLVRDAENARRFANEKLLGELLPVFDSLEAGLQAAGDTEKVREGVELTLRQLTKVAESHGLLIVNPVGEAFNPAHHQAISMMPSADHPAGVVLQVFQKGYVLNDRLLRPALVVVSGE